MKKITTALISVFHKEGLEPILDKLGELGVTIYSTGGTAKFIEQQEVNVVKVEDLTGYPSILGGRVKTLHPKVFGGILARRGEQDDLGQLAEYDIPEVDLVIVDLYPFEATVVSGAKPEDIIEKIDIGGISLIRAAAKNFTDVLTVSHCNQYDELLAMLESKGGSSLEERKYFAAEAFAVSSHYDTMIFNWFNKDFDIPALRLSINGAKTLRYGENPHQDGTFYGDPSKVFTQLHGKQTSYNNLVDIDAAIDLMREFDETTFAIIKHTNPCGVATRSTVKEAYLAALAGDPQSAFGGILICNRDIDLKAAEEIGKLFFEVLIAPAYTADALEILKKKKNRIILELKDDTVQPTLRVKSILNGAVVQDVDQELWREEDLEVVTEKGLSEESGIRFAYKIVKHLKSNTIVFTKGNQLIGMGCGQTSRIDACRQAIEKAKRLGFDTESSFMASDAFFPFPDCVEEADKAGVAAIIQPGGSNNDQASIDKCNELGIPMVFTGMRHFKH